MKRIVLAVACGCLLSVSALAQEMGLSFSYFIPRNGYFSTPISPFSIRGLGVDLNKYVALETGFSLYRMSGLNVMDMPLETKDPIVGPNFTIFVPAEVVLQFKGQQAEFNIKGGGFFFYGFDQKIMYGNLDKALRKFEGWEVANAEVTATNNPGGGIHAGVEFVFYPAKQFGISLECNYLRGQSRFPLQGRYTGGTTASGLQTRTLDYRDAKIDFTGLEFSIGVLFSGQ
ncbi:MAG: hypothetical protein MUC38_09105 [Cyclobacteriaceae bacterium]|jgi:hypothetical protein|nr:hypothetical protein [Cyclobacteriaceae bacterium]